ncbi:hypothetical protein IPZ60_06790 [Psychrobacter sp. NG25]|uniref:hypothetical protein n=1 Tax=Psychrobacter sp. NG25 TaxID=2782005 RepID=UPI00188421B2|nr:hypothetical protein [Psychrobacter sp. NG25]MBF0658442.1 hypothetical protein [Psychrobacter sp. NG25]
MKNIPCQLPDPVKFPEKLYMHFGGKFGIPIIVVMVSWFLALGHYLIGISQLWTLAILGFFFIYAVIPTKWYMQNVYRFFIGSFIGILSTSLVFYYIGWIFFIIIDIDISIPMLVVSTIIMYISIFSIESYQFRNKIDVYQQLIEKSVIGIDDKASIFSFDIWITALKNSSANLGSGISIYILLILTVPVLIIGFFGGNPLISARIILDSNQDFLAYIVMCLVSIALGVFLITFAVRELLKVIALIQLDD